MSEAAKLTRFDDRALDHFLDFSRERKFTLDKNPSESKLLDFPRFTMRLDLEPGDHVGIQALFRRMMNFDNVEVSVPMEAFSYPFVISGFAPHDDHAILDLVPSGAPEPL